jgi:hypothetical protein
MAGAASGISDACQHFDHPVAGWLSGDHTSPPLVSGSSPDSTNRRPTCDFNGRSISLAKCIQLRRLTCRTSTAPEKHESPLKAHTGCADALSMIISPKYVAWAQNDAQANDEPQSNEDAGGPGYDRYSDDQINRDLQRLLRRLDELNLHTARGPGERAVVSGIEHEVERIQHEEIRRARSRHPSSQRSAG